jgi:predicted ATPase
VPIPDVVRSTILRRLRRLSRGARDVVVHASVVGRDLSPDVVAAAARRSEPQVREALEEACRLQLLMESGPGRYSFRHALTRDVIYEEFLDARTRPLHRRIARMLERTRALRDVPLEELAYHSWAGGDARRALEYNELAGDRAIVVHACDDARRHYARARSLVEIDSAAYQRLTEKLKTAEDG